MYRNVLIAELELLRDFVGETVRQLKDCGAANLTSPYPYLLATSEIGMQ